MFDYLKNKVYSTWDSIKAWFSNSETIFLARMEVVVGFLTAVIGGLDWTPLMSMDFSNAVSNKQMLILGATIIVKGILSEIARRRNATDL